MKSLKLILYYFLGLLGIIFISATPKVFMEKHFLNPIAYIKETAILFFHFFNPEKWVFVYKDVEHNIFSFLWEPYLYSMKILLGALLLGTVLAFLLAFITFLFPKPIVQSIKQVLNVLESVPDLLAAFLLQLSIVAIFKMTGIMVFNFAAIGGEKIYLAPILSLMILPLISLYKMLVLLIEEELAKMYVDLAKSKGLKKQFILVIHVTRNVLPSIFHHSKMVLWGALSSLLVIEYIFNILGMTHYILIDFRPMVIAAALMMLFTPFFILYQLIEWVIPQPKYEGNTVKRKGEKRFTFSWIREINVKGLFFSTFKTIVLLPVTILRLLSFLGRTLWDHLKNPKFFIGFTILVGMVVYSIYHTLNAETPIRQITLLYSDEGKLLGRPPHPPSWKYVIFGTDQYGFSMLDQIVVGAKWTIIFAALIAFLRVFIGFLLAIPYTFYLKSSGKQIINKLIDSIHFLPLSLIAYVLLRPILLKQHPPVDFVYSFAERIGLEMFVLTLLVIPLTTVLFGNEINLIYHKEYITGSRVLGGDKRHILKRHILPQLGPRIGIIFGQQFIQVLLILIHLGLFQLFFGGTDVSYDPYQPDVPQSITKEWSGIISNSRYAVMSGHYWVVIPALIAFMVAILCMQLIVQGIKEVQNTKVGVFIKSPSRFKRKTKTRKEHKRVHLSEADFTFVNHHQPNN